MGLMAQVLRNMAMISLRTSLSVVLVMAVRLVFRKMPGKYFCVLWTAVFLSFLIPASFQITLDVPLQLNVQDEDFQRRIQPSKEEAAQEESTYTVLSNIIVYGWIWGIVALIVLQIRRYIRIKRRLVSAVRISGHIYETNQLDSPILFGIFCPRIYLPVQISKETAQYAVMHEQMHLYRKDSIRKLFAFSICAFYWWNPFIWLMYWFFEADMERACDEAVLEQKQVSPAAYAQSLLDMERRRSGLTGALFFASGSTRSRIKNILNFRESKTPWNLICSIFTITMLAMPCVHIQASEPSAMETPGQTPTEICERELTKLSDLPKYSIIEGAGSWEHEGDKTGLLIQILPVQEKDWECDNPLVDELVEICDTVLLNCPQVEEAYIGWNTLNSKYEELYPYYVEKKCDRYRIVVTRKDM